MAWVSGRGGLAAHSPEQATAPVPPNEPRVGWVRGGEGGGGWRWAGGEWMGGGCVLCPPPFERKASPLTPTWLIAPWQGGGVHLSGTWVGCVGWRPTARKGGRLVWCVGWGVCGPHFTPPGWARPRCFYARERSENWAGRGGAGRRKRG